MNHAGAHPSGEPTQEERDFAFHNIVAGAVPTTIESVDLSALHTFRGPQAAGSCVEYSFCEAVQDMAAAQGNPLPLLSPSHLYAHARLLASSAVPGVGLPDSGSQCRLAGQAARDVGLVADSVYADTAQNIARVPPGHVFAVGQLAKITTAHRIIATGVDDLRAQLIAALERAKPENGAQNSMPIGVIPVDDAYASLPEDAVYAAQQENPTWNGEPVSPRPNHAQLIPTYDKDRDAFAFATSWGGRRLFYVSTQLLFEIGLEFWVVGGFTRLDAMALRGVKA